MKFARDVRTPNITGFAGEVLSYQDYPYSGVFSGSSVNTGRLTNWANVEGNAQITYLLFDANKSNVVYGEANNVQPSSILLLPLIKI